MSDDPDLPVSSANLRDVAEAFIAASLVPEELKALLRREMVLAHDFVTQASEVDGLGVTAQRYVGAYAECVRRFNAELSGIHVDAQELDGDAAQVGPEVVHFATIVSAILVGGLRNNEMTGAQALTAIAYVVALACRNMRLDVSPGKAAEAIGELAHTLTVAEYN